MWVPDTYIQYIYIDIFINTLLVILILKIKYELVKKNLIQTLQWLLEFRNCSGPVRVYSLIYCLISMIKNEIFAKNFKWHVLFFFYSSASILNNITKRHRKCLLYFMSFIIWLKQFSSAEFRSLKSVINIF